MSPIIDGPDISMILAQHEDSDAIDINAGLCRACDKWRADLCEWCWRCSTCGHDKICSKPIVDGN